MILIDTTPLVALCDRRDSYHAKAVRQLGTISRQPFATCEAVVAEACFHLPHDAQRQRLRGFLAELDVMTLPGTADTEYREAVFDWLARYAEHEPDWADGCLAVLSGRDRRLTVWTYDREFRTTWRRGDGSRIPLVP